MGKETKKVLLLTSITEYKTLEPYLQKMAAKGWMLSEIKKSSMIFKKIEPRALEFNTSLFYHTTPFDYPDDEKEKDYRGLCEESGWTFCASNAIYQIFYKERGQEDIIPIHTDSKEEYEIIKKTFMKTDFISLLIILMAMVSGFLRYTHVRYDDFLSNTALFTLISPIFLILIWLALFMPPITWFIKNRYNASDGKPLLFASRKKRLAANITLWSLIGVYFLLLVFLMTDGLNGPFMFVIAFMPMAVGLVVAKFCVKRFRTKRRSRKQNLIFFFVSTMIAVVVVTSAMMIMMVSRIAFSSDENDKMPERAAVLQLSDFGAKDQPERVSSREQTSFLVPVSFEYYESLGRKPEPGEVMTVRTSYMACAGQSIADYIFDAYMEEEWTRNERRISEYLEFGNSERAAYYAEAIHEIDCGLWSSDRGFYLNQNQSEVILQIGETIYILDGDVDFSKKEIVDICKMKLGI